MCRRREVERPLVSVGRCPIPVRTLALSRPRHPRKLEKNGQVTWAVESKHWALSAIQRTANVTIWAGLNISAQNHLTYTYR